MQMRSTPFGSTVNDWLLFLGAGASVPPPSRIPAFQALSAGVLSAVGWTRTDSQSGWIWTHRLYPPFPSPAVAPEVLFGSLHSSGIAFASQIAKLLEGASPNAAHWVATAVLKAGGSVWTTNVDRGIEDACSAAGLEPTRVGRASQRAPALLQPLLTAKAGDLVKFHGTLEAPETLAFTDRELIAPLPSDELDHLSALSAGRTVVIYGYAGADADLADLLQTTLERAIRVIWFEPTADRRSEITNAFPNAPIRFEPDLAPSGDPFAATGAAFVDFASRSGASIEADIAQAFTTASELADIPELHLPDPPGLTHARLVERFGTPGDEAKAIRTARRNDAATLRVRALPGHLRWLLNDSLYGGGVAASIVSWLAQHRALLRHVRPRRVRDYAITRACALLLQQGHWRDLGAFANWAVQIRSDARGDPVGSDLYYRAHARRYEFQPALARQDAVAAASGLADARDPERLAGALYEAGSDAIYQADFENARSFGFQLRYRRGRYAIGRWQAWGAWIDAITLCHLAEPDLAMKALEPARGRFVAERNAAPIADIRTAELLAARVGLALGHDFDRQILYDESDSSRRGRYRDDLDLLLADIAIAFGDHEQARSRLERVVSDPSCPIAASWARLGIAELARLHGDVPQAADILAEAAADAHERGATWLEAQAVLGLTLCDDPRADRAWATVKQRLPARRAAAQPLDLIVGDPRILWMLTI